MLYALFLILGFLLALAFIRKPLQIKVHHVHEELKPTIDTYDLHKLEQDMLKDDAKEDELYKKLDNVLIEANEVMGGSDRIGRE